MKERFWDVVQTAMEMDEELGLERCQRVESSDTTPDYRNEYSRETVKTQLICAAPKYGFARNKNNLTQQMLADQASIGIQHHQNIENRLINPSYKVLSAIVHRLAMPTDILFYSDISRQEENKELISKFAVCTGDEILNCSSQ